MSWLKVIATTTFEFFLERRSSKKKCEYISYFKEVERDELGLKTESIIRT